MFIIPNTRGQSHRDVFIENNLAEQLVSNPETIVRTEQNFKSLREGLIGVAGEAYHYTMTVPHPIFMGGDHLTSYATVLSSLRRFGSNLRLIWIDAHTDIHSFDSSPSWNLHGMVVRMLMEHNVPGIPKLKPEQLLYVGIRSYEAEEIRFIQDNQIFRITNLDWQNKREESMKILASFILGYNTHISFDVDALDPSIMSSTGTPEPRGLTLDDFKEIVDIVRHYSSHIATDIMEFNPKLGDFERSFTTLKEVVKYLEKNTND